MKSSTGRILMGISGVLWVGIGAIFLAAPIKSTYVFASFVAILAIVSGLLSVTSWASFPKGEYRPGWKLTQGIIDILFGVVILWNPAAGILVFPILLALYLFFSGGMQIAGSFVALREGAKNWWVTLISGLLSIWVAILAFQAPIRVFALYIAILVIFYGVFNILAAILHKDGPTEA